MMAESREAMKAAMTGCNNFTFCVYHKCGQECLRQPLPNSEILALIDAAVLNTESEESVVYSSSAVNQLSSACPVAFPEEQYNVS